MASVFLPCRSFGASKLIYFGGGCIISDSLLDTVSVLIASGTTQVNGTFRALLHFIVRKALQQQKHSGRSSLSCSAEVGLSYSRAADFSVEAPLVVQTLFYANQ